MAESRTLHGVDLTGAVQWSYSDVPDDSIWRSGFFISNGMLYLASGPPPGDSTLRVLAVDTGTIVNELTSPAGTHRVPAEVLGRGPSAHSLPWCA